MIKEIDANNSNLTNTELTYIAVMPKMSKNTRISFFTKVLIILFDLFESSVLAV